MSGLSKFKDSFDSLGYMRAGTPGAGTIRSFTAQRAYKEHHAVPRHSGLLEVDMSISAADKNEQTNEPNSPS